MTRSGSWYGDKRYFGLHYDLHANSSDTELGKNLKPAELAASLKRMDGETSIRPDCRLRAEGGEGQDETHAGCSVVCGYCEGIPEYESREEGGGGYEAACRVSWDTATVEMVNRVTDTVFPQPDPSALISADTGG